MKASVHPLHRVSGESWNKPFPTTKEDKNGDEVPFITYVGGEARGKSYPYGSTRQGYDAPDIFVDVISLEE